MNNIYCYNLQFSLSDANRQLGMFEPADPSQPVLSISSAWLSYNGTGTQPPVFDDNRVLPPLNANQWSLVPPAQQNPLTVNSVFSGPPTDFVFVRIFNTDGLAQPQLRLTAVLGRGKSSQPASTNNSQSPFLLGANARPVIDFDNSAANPNWVTPGTDGNWTFCLGGIHGNANDYTCNVGVSVYVPQGQPFQGISVFGQDPQLHVVMPNALTANCESAA